MDTADPDVAQQVVSDYVRLLEEQASANVYPADVDTLPHPKEVIKAAIRTSVTSLGVAGAMTSDMRAFLEIAYISLADYVETDLVRLMREYHDAGDQLAADGGMARAKLDTPAWERLAASGRLVGELARTMAEETERLREEFRAFADARCR